MLLSLYSYSNLHVTAIHWVYSYGSASLLVQTIYDISSNYVHSTFDSFLGNLHLCVRGSQLCLLCFCTEEGFSVPEEEITGEEKKTSPHSSLGCYSTSK